MLYMGSGSVAEWSNAPLSKSGMLARASGVRILSLPQAQLTCKSGTDILCAEIQHDVF